MTAKDCIKERRSIRKFKAEPVDHALLSEIIETASYAPSWKHTQITRYIAVEGELKDKIAAECTLAYPRNGEIIAQAPLLQMSYRGTECGKPKRRQSAEGSAGQVDARGSGCFDS